jgi:hypothetical protein
MEQLVTELEKNLGGASCNKKIELKSTTFILHRIYMLQSHEL